MKKTKIPVPIIVFVALLIVFVIILLALVMPTFTNLSKYNDDHAAITAKIADCDDVLANQTSVETKIDEMTKQYNENQENLYIDAKSSVKDLQDILPTSVLICHHLPVVKACRTHRAEHLRAVFRFTTQTFYSAIPAQRIKLYSLFIILSRNQKAATLLIRFQCQKLKTAKNMLLHLM